MQDLAPGDQHGQRKEHSRECESTLIPGDADWDSSSNLSVFFLQPVLTYFALLIALHVPNKALMLVVLRQLLPAFGIGTDKSISALLMFS